MDQLKFGIAGAGGRPSAFISAFALSGKAALTAACDPNREAREKALENMPEVLQYDDYEEMLEKGGIDAIIIGTPLPLHVEQSIMALKKGIHVFSEVPAALTIDEAKMLVAACKSSTAHYMMGENCNYLLSFMMMAEMVRQNALGEVFYAEGEYLHDCRNLLDTTPWRRKHLVEAGGVTYGTHNLGPILACFPGDRISSVSCMGSGSHNVDLSGKPIAPGQDTFVMLGKTEQGRLIKLRMDVTSPRPYGLYFTIQGTKGAFECERIETDELGRCWMEGHSQPKVWDDIFSWKEQYTPKLWRDYGELVKAEGHGGSDVMVMLDFIDSIYNGLPAPLDVHASLDMTLPGLVSSLSAANNGAWLDVPNSRNW